MGVMGLGVGAALGIVYLLPEPRRDEQQDAGDNISNISSISSINRSRCRLALPAWVRAGQSQVVIRARRPRMISGRVAAGIVQDPHPTFPGHRHPAVGTHRGGSVRVTSAPDRMHLSRFIRPSDTKHVSFRLSLTLSADTVIERCAPEVRRPDCRMIPAPHDQRTL